MSNLPVQLPSVRISKTIRNCEGVVLEHKEVEVRNYFLKEAIETAREIMKKELR